MLSGVSNILTVVENFNICAPGKKNHTILALKMRDSIGFYF